MKKIGIIRCMQTDLAMAPEYERLIVSELQLRSNRALLHVR